MNAEEIKAIKVAHPELFAQKRRFLSEADASIAIANQLAHDKANPPVVSAIMKAREAIAHALAMLLVFQSARHGAELLRNAALEIDPEAELPELPSAGNVNAADVEELIAGYRSQADRDSHSIADLQTELKAAQELLEDDSQDAERALLLKLRGCNNIKEVRDVFAAFDAGVTATE